MEAIYTVGEAAATLKVDAQTIRRMLQQGRLRGRKVGKAWRISESALRRIVAVETMGPSSTMAPENGMATNEREGETIAQADAIWAAMLSGDDARRDAAIIALGQVPPAVRSIIMHRSGEAAAIYYATPEGEAELADWRALDGEPFHDDEGDGDDL